MKTSTKRKLLAAGADGLSGVGSAEFDAIVKRQTQSAGVEAGRMFGSLALKADGKVFAMLVKGWLVVKLPASRANALTAASVAAPFDPGHGRIMKEWVSFAPSERARWAGVVAEAREFVSKAAGNKGKRK